MSGPQHIDYDAALVDPTSFFSDPAAVVRCGSLTREQRIEILRRWDYDARELLVAQEENMAGGPPGVLAEIQDAMRELGADPHSQEPVPTKHG